MNDGKWRLADWAAVAEIVAALAVMASLLYVGREIQQNTAATQGATYQQVVRASNEYLLAIAGDSALAAITIHAASDSTTLNATDRVRYFHLRRVFWRNMENAFVQHERGVLGDAEWDTYHRILCGNARTDASWPSHKGSLSPTFVAMAETC